MHRPVVTLTTDFGDAGQVAQMKAVLLSCCPQVTIVDIDHSIPPQDIRAGAMMIGNATTIFPKGTTHIVDPGVGSDRDIVLVEAGGCRYVIPDNGLIQLVL